MTVEQMAKKYVDLQLIAYKVRNAMYGGMERRKLLSDMDRLFGAEARHKAIKVEQAKHGG